jgi:F-type H+-transporting ATPase subunit delta
MPQHAIAARYAQAFAGAVLSPGAGLEPEQALDELRRFESMMKDSAELRNILLSPAVSTARKRAVVARFADMIPLSLLVRNFLFVIIDRRRAAALGEIIAAFRAALDERLGLVRASVTTAAPLNERQQEELQQTLTQVAGKQVRCSFEINPELIGGVVARIGSTVYDGSVRTQLESLRERLASR